MRILKSLSLTLAICILILFFIPFLSSSSTLASDQSQNCGGYFTASIKKLAEKIRSFRIKTQKKQSARVAICQTDTTVGDFDYNVRQIIRFVEKAAEQNAEIAIFPELVLSSYPPRDLLDRSDFLLNNQRALEEIQLRLRSISNAPKTLIFGSITASPSPRGKRLQNSAIILHNGELVHVQPKRLLPNYDVFDESRYFEPGKTKRTWSSPWGQIGCLVCEDAWHRSTDQGRSLYSTDLSKKIKSSDLAVSINASPFEIGKNAKRQKIISQFAKDSHSPLIYVNQVGAQDDLLFDGRSGVYSQRGDLLFEMPSFLEAIGIVDIRLDALASINTSQIFTWEGNRLQWSSSMEPTSSTEYEEIENAIVMGIRGYFTKVGYEKAVLGLSGGIDSSVVATLAVKALGADNVIGISMPSKYSSSSSLTDAEELAHNLGIKYLVSPIKDAVASISHGLDSGFQTLLNQHGLKSTLEDTTEDNIQARLRAVLLTAFANKFDGLVLTTSNKSELAVGTITTYGDMAGALAPIGDLYKTRVYELARHLNAKKHRIPLHVLSKPASAELAPGQTDEAKFGRWEVLDPLLKLSLEDQLSESEIIAQGFDPAYVHRITKYIQTNEFKRSQSAIVLKLTPKAFGSGRRIPLSSYQRPVFPKEKD